MSERTRGRPKRSASSRRTKPIIGDVNIERFFALSGTDDQHVGECCYISTTINSRRYYGLLVDQESLKEASDLYFQDQASSLQLNQRIQALQKHAAAKPEGDLAVAMESAAGRKTGRQVQKFRYCAGNRTHEGYREILATYANVIAASEDDLQTASAINEACESGGNWVGKYYYQYEVPTSSLKVSGDNAANDMNNGSVFHTSMSFTTFLFNTTLPAWYPLQNITTSRKRIMNMFNMKFDSKGALKREEDAKMQGVMSTTSRTNFRIGVVGAGLGGLSCAQELLRLGKKENIDVQVKMFEARDRVGGRCATDKITFKRPDGTPFPVDLGAAWIHGTTGNPLALLARDTNNKMIPQGTGVKMLMGGMKEADESVDERVRELFDEMLEQGAKECWDKDDLDLTNRRQKATRFYATLLKCNNGNNMDVNTTERDVALHRFSSDTSVGLAINGAMTAELGKMTKEESNLLKWNTKHTEYSFGANLSNLSMRYWDADEEHALEGKHVVLKDGYSSLAESLRKKCEKSGGKFELKTNYPVGTIKYDIKCFAQERVLDGLIGVSDSCQISSKDGNDSEYFDFIVCALPLGILKESVQITKDKSKVSFIPKLPESKLDAIEHMGYGLLNKVYIQFPFSFWRKRGRESDLRGSVFLSDAASSFGNASSVNPHHYLFYDVGFDNEYPENPQDPSILYTLMSGDDAVKGEQLSDKDIIADVMTTLRHLFSDISVPSPVKYKISRWASDEYSRGSYSFLAPGCTEEDFITLRSPVCGNGDDFTAGDSEIMRLFFAGEHTSLQYPSMTHGAYVSGIRAAQDVFGNIQTGRRKATSDRVVPISRFRMKNPTSHLKCQLCRKPRTEKEGALIAFQRGKNGVVLIHSNCAEYSPDVKLKGSNWHGVLKCINRGRQLRCVKCGLTGGTIGCHVESCTKNYHFGCIDSGWDFETDGKEFYCLLHRGMKEDTSSPNDNSDASSGPAISIREKPKTSGAQVESSIRGNGTCLTREPKTDKAGSTDSSCKNSELELFRKRNPLVPLRCFLCNTEEGGVRGNLVAFDENGQQALAHDNCQRYTNIVKKSITNKTDIFAAIKASKRCVRCKNGGATIKCNFPSCEQLYHFPCANDTGWNFNSVGALFLCPGHRLRGNSNTEKSNPSIIAKMRPNVASTLTNNKASINGENHGNGFSVGSSNTSKVVSMTVDSVVPETQVTKMGGCEHPPTAQSSGKKNMPQSALTITESTGPLMLGANSTSASATENGPFVHDLFHVGANTCTDQDKDANGLTLKKRKRNYGPSNEFDFGSLRDKMKMKDTDVNIEGSNDQNPIIEGGKKREKISASNSEEPEPKPDTTTSASALLAPVHKPAESEQLEVAPVEDRNGEHGENLPHNHREVITIDSSSDEGDKSSGEEWENNSQSNSCGDSEDGLSMYI